MKRTWLNCDSIPISSLSWRIQTLFILPSQPEVQPKGFSMIQSHWIHDPVTLDSLTVLLSHPSSTLKHLHPHSSSPKTTMVQRITKIFMCLGHLSASLRVLLFHYFVSQLFPWKEIFQTKKTEAYFIILQSTKPVKENWKQINYLELFLRKFPGH